MPETNGAGQDGAVEYKDDEFRELYVNAIRVDINTYDFAVTLGILQPGTNEVAQHTRIYLSPQQAKSLELLMSKFVRLYEQNVGPIFLPSNLETRLREGSSDEQEN